MQSTADFLCTYSGTACLGADLVAPVLLALPVCTLFLADELSVFFALSLQFEMTQSVYERRVRERGRWSDRVGTERGRCSVSLARRGVRTNAQVPRAETWRGFFALR